jgi:hypothetical protein
VPNDRLVTSSYAFERYDADLTVASVTRGKFYDFAKAPR